MHLHVHVHVFNFMYLIVSEIFMCSDVHIPVHEYGHIHAQRACTCTRCVIRGHAYMYVHTGGSGSVMTLCTLWWSMLSPYGDIIVSFLPHRDVSVSCAPGVCCRRLRYSLAYIMYASTEYFCSRPIPLSCHRL